MTESIYFQVADCLVEGADKVASEVDCDEHRAVVGIGDWKGTEHGDM